MNRLRRIARIWADRWAAFKRGVLARLNGGRHKRRLAFDAAAPEVKPVLMTLAKLEDRAHQLRKGGECR